MSDAVQGLGVFWAPGSEPLSPDGVDTFLTEIVGEELMTRFQRQLDEYLDGVLERRGRLMEAALALTPVDRWHLLVELDVDVDPFGAPDRWTVACVLPPVEEPESRWTVQQGRTMGCSWTVPLRAFAFPMIFPD